MIARGRLLLQSLGRTTTEAAMNRFIICAALAALAAGSALAEEPKHHFQYGGASGPAHWGDLESDFAACKTGKEQSPIDIHGAAKAPLPPIGFHYASGPAQVTNTGHSIQVDLSDGGTADLASGTYKLVQFHFHAPSEEKIDGHPYAMVAHLVHRNDAGQLAVVAVLFKEGKPNPTLAKVFAIMPAQEGAKVALQGGANATDLLPAVQSYYAYVGSLTTPPCTEGVRWQVLKQPVELSKEQLAAFRKLYPMNARPVQPLNGRKVEQNGN
jgi:carbonic anhydrase